MVTIRRGVPWLTRRTPGASDYPICGTDFIASAISSAG